MKSFFSVAFTVNSACKMFVPHRNNCFELYGFDILVDQQLKPWLLEASSRSVGSGKKIIMQVNLSPSLNTDTPVDVDIKTRLLRDLLTLVGLPAVDPVLGRAEAEQQAAGRRGRRVRSAGGSQPGDPFAHSRAAAGFCSGAS